MQHSKRFGYRMIKPEKQPQNNLHPIVGQDLNAYPTMRCRLIAEGRRENPPSNQSVQFCQLVLLGQLGGIHGDHQRSGRACARGTRRHLNHGAAAPPRPLAGGRADDRKKPAEDNPLPVLVYAILSACLTWPARQYPWRSSAFRTGLRPWNAPPFKLRRCRAAPACGRGKS